ncbi:MAG: hypothetical protein H7Y17_10595 [Chlorobia bacterium]|nr:hypothetical protein [Fimbriimonadaceae bacterium]
MRKIVLILPGWLGEENEDSVLRQNLPGISRLAELGELSKLTPPPQTETPEALVLGMAPNLVNLAQGPLTIAALGADPPEKSTHFHLSPIALMDNVLHEHALDLPPEQVDFVMERAKNLNTRNLTIVVGEGTDHGLVWEGLGDLGTTNPHDANGKTYLQSLPQGDNEPALRRFIDDSVNILSELELNAERIDQGLLPINVLWPWGQGVRHRVPNLALQRGEPVEVVSPSLRLAGLTRLAGYRHAPRNLIDRGLNANWQTLAKKLLGGSTTVIWCPVFQELREKDQLEEASWLSKEIDEMFVDPILASARELSTRFAILSPSQAGNGLSALYETKMNGSNVIPFDERALEERLAGRQLHEFVDAFLSP